MVKIAAAKLPSRKTNKRELYATVCYYYPQYTLKMVQDMAARDLNLLITTARRLEALKMYNLTQIVAAPHSKKGKGVSKLLEYFKKVANG